MEEDHAVAHAGRLERFLEALQRSPGPPALRPYRANPHAADSVCALRTWNTIEMVAAFTFDASTKFRGPGGEWRLLRRGNAVPLRLRR